MSHEVIQVIKLIKYNKKSHEMITATCKCLPTTINTEKQTLTGNDAVSKLNRHLVFTARTGTDLRIILWAGLRIACASGPEWIQIWVSCYRVRIARTSPKRCNTQLNIQKKYKYILNTLPSTPTHTCTPTHTYGHICIYPHTYTQALTHTHTHLLINTYMHAYMHTQHIVVYSLYLYIYYIHTYILCIYTRIPMSTHEHTHAYLHTCTH